MKIFLIDNMNIIIEINLFINLSNFFNHNNWQFFSITSIPKR